MDGETQHRPISTDETSYEAGLTSRIYCDTALSLNNAKAHALRQKIRGECLFPRRYSPDTSTTETAVLWGTAVFVPMGYTTALFAIGHELTAGTQVTWTAYVNWSVNGILYDGPPAVSTTYLAPGYATATIRSTVAAHKCSAPATITLPPRGSKSTHLYLLISAKNADVSSRGYIDSVDITPAL